MITLKTVFTPLMLCLSMYLSMCFGSTAFAQEKKTLPTIKPAGKAPSVNVPHLPTTVPSPRTQQTIPRTTPAPPTKPSVLRPEHPIRVIKENKHDIQPYRRVDTRIRHDGKPADFHVASRNMDIHNGLNGNRRIEMVRADHSRLVSERGGRGYLERPFGYGGHDFARRTYIYHGRAYQHYYGHYYYRGRYLDYYAPAYFYRPAFYSWVYYPWAAPAPYVWGWVGSPWYAYYGPAYFVPYPVYSTASFWLTDYLLSVSLASAYEAQRQLALAQQAEVVLPPDAYGITQDVKGLIAQEVQRQLTLENDEAQRAAANPASVGDPASDSIQRMLTDGASHIFIAGHDLDILNATGAECAISQGDALQLAGPPPPDATAATLIVLSSKGGVECRRSDSVQVQLADLQEMQNHMRQTIDAGLESMQTAKGLPPVPPPAAGPPITPAFVASAPPPDSNVAAELDQQVKEADSAEHAATNGPPSPPVTSSQVRNGQSMEEVTRSLGQPLTIASVGAKTIYVYQDLKITFQANKVTSVQ